MLSMSLFALFLSRASSIATFLPFLFVGRKRKYTCRAHTRPHSNTFRYIAACDSWNPGSAAKAGARLDSRRKDAGRPLLFSLFYARGTAAQTPLPRLRYSSFTHYEFLSCDLSPLSITQDMAVQPYNVLTVDRNGTANSQLAAWPRCHGTLNQHQRHSRPPPPRPHMHLMVFLRLHIRIMIHKHKGTPPMVLVSRLSRETTSMAEWETATRNSPRWWVARSVLPSS